MKNTILTTLAFIMVSCGLFAQHSIERQAITTSGGFGDTGSHVVSSTTGEMATATFIGGTFQLTQGFQQSDDVISGVNDHFLTVDFKFFPNPTPGHAWLELEMPISTELNFDVLDVTGKNLQRTTQVVHEGNFRQSFDLEALTPGTYFIQISAFESGLFQTIKFVRI